MLHRTQDTFQGEACKLAANLALSEASNWHFHLQASEIWRTLICTLKVKGLTAVRHAHREALVEAAVLALVAILLLDLAVALASVVLQLQPDGPPEETLAEAEFVNVKNIVRKSILDNKLSHYTWG